LLDAFAPRLVIEAYEHGTDEEPRPTVRQRVCAVKPGSGYRAGATGRGPLRSP
jgi:hypothetical protein